MIEAERGTSIFFASLARHFNMLCFHGAKLKYSNSRGCGRGLRAQTRPANGYRKCGWGPTPLMSPLIGHTGTLLTAPTCTCGRMTHIIMLTHPGNTRKYLVQQPLFLI